MRAAKWRMFALLLLLAMLAVGLAQADVVTTGGVTLPTLQEQLSTGLLARTPQEQRFVAKVVTLVNENALPLDLVQSTFLWARKKRPYPMPYFERALILRAAAQGISFP